MRWVAGSKRNFAVVVAFLAMLVLAYTTSCRPRQVVALNLVTSGMPKVAVRELLGPPGHREVKRHLGDYRFGQGALEKQIKEGWIYGDAGTWDAEVYFDTTGRVVGKNQGQG